MPLISVRDNEKIDQIETPKSNNKVKHTKTEKNKVGQKL